MRIDTAIPDDAEANDEDQNEAAVKEEAEAKAEADVPAWGDQKRVKRRIRTRK